MTEVKTGPEYQKTTGFEVVAVRRRDTDKAADYLKRYAISKYHTNADDLVDAAEIYAIDFATLPVDMSYRLQVAVADKIRCIERSLAPNYHYSLAIYNAFAAKKIFCLLRSWTAHYHVFNR